MIKLRREESKLSSSRMNRAGTQGAPKSIQVVLFAFDQNNFTGPDMLVCYMCKTEVKNGGLRTCEDGCGVIFCEPCADSFFVNDRCCMSSKSPTYPDRRQKSMVTFLGGTCAGAITKKRTQPKRNSKNMQAL